MKYLGAEIDTKIFHVTSSYIKDDFPLSNIEDIDYNTESRKNILEDLGYELYDFEIWSAWLFLEESSAERIIREYLIPWYVPKLDKRIRTFACGGNSKIESKFEDFNKLFVFLHLQEIYKNKVWVYIDSGEEEKKIIDKLKEKYSTKNGWSENNFQQFSKHNFEEYYPKEFKEKFENFKNETDKKKLKEEKENLLKELIAWIGINPTEAEKQFQVCFEEIINKLKEIQDKI